MTAIIWGRWRELRRKPGLFLIMLFLPLLFSSFFGLFMKNSDYTISVQVLDLDESYESLGIIRELEINHISPESTASETAFFKGVSEKSPSMGIIIPKGFGHEITHREAPKVYIVKSSDGTEVFALEGILRSLLMRQRLSNVIVEEIANSMEEMMGESVRKEELPIKVRQTVEQKWQEQLPVIIESQFFARENPVNANFAQQTSIGFILFFAMMNITFILGRILGERQTLIWDRLMVSPLSKLQVYSGNMLFAFLAGFMQISILIVLTGLIFGVNWGNSIGGVLMIMGFFIFCSASLGLFLTSAVKTFGQLSSIVPVITISTSMLGGAFWPVELVNSKGLLILSKMTPQRWAIKGIMDLTAYGKGIDAIYLPCAVLLCISIVLLSSGVVIAAREG